MAVASFGCMAGEVCARVREWTTDFRSVDGEGDGGGCASAGGDGGHGDDLGGDFALGEESFEGGDDLVLHGAVGGHGADEERDAGVEGSGELGGLPPDEVGELGGEYVFCRHGLEVEDEAGGCGLEADVGEEAGVADALGGCLDCGGSGGGSGFEAADGEEVGLGVGRGSGEADLGEDDGLGWELECGS